MRGGAQASDQPLYISGKGWRDWTCSARQPKVQAAYCDRTDGCPRWILSLKMMWMSFRSVPKHAEF